MGDAGKPADKTGSDTANKTAAPLEPTPTATPADKTAKPVDSSNPGDSALSPIAQIAVDNQAGKLPGTPVPDKDAVDGQGNLNIKPIIGPEKTEGGKEKPEVAAANPEPTADLKPRSVELAQLPPSSVYRDGLSDAIDLTVRRVSQLPVDDKARQLVVRDLAEQFQHPKSYAEKLQAAKALMTLTKGPDGLLPDTVAMRDVAIAERGHRTQAYRGSPSKYVLEVAAHHELQPLKGWEVLDFVKNSGESLEQQVKALKDKPADDKDRHNLQQQLTMIFQTYQDDTPEKLAAAKGLLELNRKADGTYPDTLGSRTIEYAAQEIPAQGRYAQKKIIPAHTGTVSTTKSQVEAYLAPRSEALLSDTAQIVSFRERSLKAGANGADAPSKAEADADAQRKNALYNRSVHIFLDSKIPENKTAAAIALLELRTGTDGSIGDNLGSRNVHENAVIKRGTGRYAKDVEVSPAKDYVQSISKDDAIKYLQSQLDPAVLPRERMMAADALKSAKVIDETRYKEIVRGVISDDRTSDSLKTELRKSSGVEQKQEQLKLAPDGRVIGAKPEDYVPISNDKGERDRLQLTLDRLAKNPDLKALVSDKQIEEMDRELKSGKFGPASRDFYNKSANYLNELTTNLAVTIIGRNGKLPEDSTLTVPRDSSGRAVGDDYFRAQILSGRLKMDLKTLKPGELPEGERLSQTALWDVKAVKELDNLRLKWEVSVFDDQLKGFNKDGKLDAWMSNDKMSIDELRELQSARGEWLQLGMQVRNYAHAIHYFNKATTEASNIPRLSFSQAEMSKFSDEALSDANFPGKVVRENGKIKSVEIDLPKTLSRSIEDNDPKNEDSNIAKINKLRAWLEKYGPQVDQLTDEIKKASIDSGRLLMWGDIEHEGVDEVTKKPYNFTALRFDSERVKVKMPDGTEEERIKVSSSRQHKYAGDLSLYKTVGDIQDVGNPVTSGETKVNGKVIPVNAGDAGVTLGTEGTIKVTGDSVEPNHASMRVAVDGRVFIKDNGSKSGTYIGGEKIESQKWVEVFPDQNVTLGKPATSLALGRNEKGEPTFNGQTLKVGEPTKIGTKAGIKAEGDGVSAEHSLVKVEADGRMFIKDNGSEKGTYVNGKKVSDKEWTQISDKDKVTFGPPPSALDIEGDVRLYKPGDMVTVLVDGQMQLMPAENLKSWSNEAAAWHYTGKGAMALMDLGMIVTATYELKGIQVAAMQGAKELGKVGARAVFNEMIHSPGFARAAWHAGLGVTGIFHQSIENSGPFGKKFNELRGYAMMADIFYGSVIKDGVSLSRKAFGMAKPAEQASAAAEYIKVTPWAKVASNVTEKMFLGMNGYFVGDILAHQRPAIVTSMRKLDTAALLNAGMLLRAGQYDYGADKGIPPIPTLEDQARKFTSADGQAKITQTEKEATEAAKLPKEQKKERQEYLAKLTSQFLDSTNQDDKLAAAFGLLTFHAQDSKSIPNVLGTRWKTQNDLPDNVTSANVKAFIDSKIPRSIDLFDKQLQTGVESRFADVAKLSSQPEGSPERKQLNDKLLREFTSSTTENDRVSAAMGLMLLNEHDGKVPEKLGTVDGADVTSKDISAVLDAYKSKAVLARFDGYVDTMKGNESLNTVLGKTRDLIAKSDNAEERQVEATRLQAVFENSTNRDEKAAAALGLIFLNADKQTGAFPEKLAETKYKQPVEVYDEESDSYKTEFEDRVRELKTKDVIGYLKGNIASFSPGTQLAMGDLLYRADEAPMAGRNKFNDYAGLLLSVVQNKNASPEERKQALVNPNGLGMAEAMAIHRFNTEPGLSTIDKNLAAKTEADIYGRDSKAMEKALLDIIAQPNADKDLRALASTTLLANSEPDPVKRKAMLTQMQTDYAQSKGTPGAYYNLVFQRESETVKGLLKDGNEPSSDEDLSKLYRAAVIMSQNNNWKEFGITDQQMALSFEAALTGQNAVLASHALEPMLKHYNALDGDAKKWVEHNLLDLVKNSHGLPGTPGNLLRSDVIGHLEQINSVLGPEFAAKARQNIAEVLTPDSVPNKTSDPETRAALVRALAKTSSNDVATQDLLKQVVGSANKPGDSSALVRSAALDRLAELKPAGINQWAAKLLETEKDPEVLRKLGIIEQSSRRQDPDSSEYRERFRQSLNKMMESAAGKYTLANVPNFIRSNYPMLEWTTQFRTSAEKAQKELGNWKWTWQKDADLFKPYLDAGKAETSRQLDQVIAKAARPEGDMERRTLAWIVMSNGRFFDESTKKDAVQRAAQGLLNASLGDATTKAQVAPLLTMAIATQDRMPYEARNTLVTALENLAPGTPGSPVTKEDAGVALLAGLKRQFERTPRDGNDPNYKASHDLQMHLLDAYSKYATTEAIPILEAIAANQTKVGIVRDQTDRVKDVSYPDKGSRSVDYDQNNEVWKVSNVTSGGVKQTLIRQGSSDEWYDEADATKKTVWRGKVSVDQTNASIQMADSFGKSITYTADGAAIQRTGADVTKVTYSDGSSREITASQDTITYANGLKETWSRKANTNTWTSDTDPAKKAAFNGTRSFDAQGNVVLTQGADKQVIRPDSSSIFYNNDKPTYSTPSTSEYSAHSMPLIRERAKQMLGDLRDGTDALLVNLPLDTKSTPQQLADNLRKIAQDKDSNSETVARAVLVAGLSKPLTGAADPRRAVLQDMLRDPHERISMAAARVLFTGNAEDRAMAAKVIADIAKNGSKSGFRDDANRLIAEVKKQAATPGNTSQADALLLETALRDTKSAPRIDTGRFEAPHTIDQQEKYEQATGALIRDNLLPMDGLEKPEWWTQHGYKLLESGNYVDGIFETSDSVKFNFWEKIKARFTDTDVKAKFQSAFDNFNKSRDDQIKLLTDRAMSVDDTEDSRDARKALAFIVLSNGYPLTENIRNATVNDAAGVLAKIYTRGGPGAAYAEQIITDALVANPAIDIGVRTQFARAVIERQGLDESVKGNASAPKAALLLANALDAEAWAMPTPGQPGYQNSIDFQSMIMMRLDRLGEPIAMPVLEAMSKAHPNADLRRRAGEMFDRLKDGTSILFEHTVPDTTSSKADQAKAIAELLNRKDIPKDDTELARELVRLAHPRTFDKETGPNDPRVAVLRSALNHSSERVRLIAAIGLNNTGDPRGVIEIAKLQDSTRSGIQREATLDYQGTFMARFALGNMTPEGESFARQTMKDSTSERARIAAARLILVDHPDDAKATEVLVKSYASGPYVPVPGEGIVVGELRSVPAESVEAIKDMLQRTPIVKAEDPRRAVLTTQLNSADQQAQLAAAWLLSHSPIQGDFERAITTLGRLAVNSPAKEQAQALLKDVISKGSDKQQAFALKQWNDSWVAKGSPAADKPAVPGDLEQARKFFRSADAGERAKLFALPEAEKKALIMQLSGKSEQEIEFALQPPPSADFITRESFADPFKLSSRPENLFRLPGLADWTGSGFSNRPLSSSWQPGDTTRWGQRVSTLGNSGLGNIDGGAPQPYYRATTRGVPSLSGPGGIRPLGSASGDGKTPFIRVDADNVTGFLNLDQDKTGKYTAKDSAALARLSFANMLQDESRTGSVVRIGRDGKFSLQPEGEDAQDDPSNPNGRKLRFALPATDGRKPLTLDGSTPTPPEFSDFLEFLSKNRPDVMQQQSIKSSELSVMFLQYLRQREAGLQTGFVVTPSLFDNNVEALTSDRSVVQWRTQNINGSANQNREWTSVQRERERMRAGKLDEQLTRLLTTEDKYPGPGAHWQPSGKVEIAKPELLSKPPVENLEVNRLGLTDILPAELLGGGRQSIGRIRLISTTGDTTFTPVDVRIPTALLNAELWRAKQLQDTDRIQIGRTGRTTRLANFQLSPESQEILRRFRRVRLENQIDTLNKWPGQ